MKHLHILTSFNQSSCILHLEIDGGVLELLEAILLLLELIMLLNVYFSPIGSFSYCYH